MTCSAVVLLAALAGASPSPATAQSPRDGLCTDWRDCRERALAAAARGEYETFHDLAWRAVQTGPKNNPALMFLLARAQSLSGRPHDALVMLQRLADIGAASDAVTSEDFSRTRQLPGWSEVEGRIRRLGRPDAPPPVSAAAPPLAAPPAATVPASRSAITLAPAADAIRFSTNAAAVSGVAYDAPSRRFVLGDRLGRKLIVVDERSSQAMDLVRADSAGFQEIAAVEIDAKRGDLWVASAAAAGGGPATLHKLQLVSGRPLKAFHAAGDLEPVRLVDLAIGQGGIVLALDAIAPQLLVLRTGGTSLERVVRLDAHDAVSVATGGDDSVAYVAHGGGVSRVDLRARTVSPVSAPDGISLARLERIRWHGKALVAVQADPDGVRRIVRLELNARGTAVTQATRLEVSVPAGGQSFVTVSGDELVYLTPGSPAERSSSSDPSPRAAEFLAFRVPLR